MKRAGWFTTGEFAGLAGVSKDTLFHYDRIGLLKPETVEENGYRYYSLGQVDVCDVIRMLKELGMPLAEIREYLEGRTVQSLLQLFEREEKVLLKKINDLEQSRSWLLRKKESLEQSLGLDFAEVTVERQPGKYYISRTVNTADEAVWVKKAGELLADCEANGIRSSYGFGYRIKTKMAEKAAVVEQKEKVKLGERTEQEGKTKQEEKAEEKGKTKQEERMEEEGKGKQEGKADQLRYDTVYLLLDEKPETLPYRERRAGDYVVLYHVGDWRGIGAAYGRLLAYAKEQKLILGEDCFEDAVIDSLTEKNPENYVTRILCEVKGRHLS